MLSTFFRPEDRASVFVSQFVDALSTRQHLPLKISTKIIFDHSQWQQTTTLPRTKKAAISSLILTMFRGDFASKPMSLPENDNKREQCFERIARHM